MLFYHLKVKNFENYPSICVKFFYHSPDKHTPKIRNITDENNLFII